jgi:hypothetical protein
MFFLSVRFRVHTLFGLVLSKWAAPKITIIIKYGESH